MAVIVLPVDTTEYTSEAFDDLIEAVSVMGDAATQGVVRGMLNALAVSGASSPVAVATGWAIVKGKLVKNTASANVNVASPVTHPRIDRIVLEIDYSTSPVSASIVRVAGTEDPAPTAPALTQTDGTKWQLSLAQVHITTGGVITLTDERRYIGHGHVDGDAIPDDTIDSQHYVDGSIDTAHVGDDQVTDGKLRNSAALSVIGRGANSVGDPADIAAGTDGHVLMRNGAALEFNQTKTAGILAKAVTKAKMEDEAGVSVIGRGANSAGVPADIVAATNGHVLRRKADVVAFGLIDEDSIEDATDLQAKHVNVDTLDGLHAADIVSGGVLLGAILLWFGTLGGTDSHRPMVGGIANEDWHLCNGDTVGGVVTPDLRNRFVVGAGSTYAKGATGGATTASHTHTAGTLLGAGHVHAADLVVQAHDHSLSLTSGTGSNTTTVQAGAGATVPSTAHTHTTAGDTLNSGSNATGDTLSSGVAMSGSTAAAAPSILPPYYSLYYLMKVA